MMRYLLSTGLLLAGLLPTSLLADCQPLEHPAQRLEALAQATHEDKLLQTPALGLLTGEPITALPALSLETSEAVAARSKQRLKQLRCIDPAALTADERNSWYALQYALEQARDFAPHHRLRFDVTPYSLGLVMSSVLPVALTSTPGGGSGPVATTGLPLPPLEPDDGEEKVPGAHSVCAVAPVGQAEPAGHAVQSA